ncbi:MAG TPA: LuxR C-terminal-related transcriptional regulator [Streptosporangiaceae bacterium]|nr:LuxR C-terminal-related transcriptional regulator [Streptosporangiaceae bacterium]
MAEPPAAPAGDAASGQDVLLATKLHVPRPLPGFVSRPRLVARLGEGAAAGVAVVSAPAGFGKTALVADWARAGDQPVAWLSLDAGDNDPVRFWRHAIGALDRVRPGLSARVGAFLGPPAPASFEGLVTALINELAQPGDGDVSLVLDDYHLIDAQPVHASLTFLLEHRPPGLHLVLASRADPTLPLARLRAGGHLAELRADDLRFSEREAADLLREAAGADLPGAAVRALAARTEGWVAGLQLAGLSLRGQADPARFVASFSGSHRYVLDYLAEEVLERQSEQVREFLLETSVLDRLSGPLCDAVTGRSGSQAMLEKIEKANLFLLPLDEVRGWWRYHHLFADLLRARLQAERPGQVAELHRAAAVWHDEHGAAGDAVRHALAAGDTVWAARLIERYADELHLRSERATLQLWHASLPAELVATRPRLLLADGRMALLGGRVEEAEVALKAAERAWAGAPAAQEPFEPSVGRGASVFANVPATIALEHAFLAEFRGDAESMTAFASRALGEVGEDEWMLASLAGERMAVAEWLRGRLGEAEPAIGSRVARFRAAGEPTMTAWGGYYLGLVQRAQGRLDAAVRTYQQVLEITAPPGGPALPAAGIAHVGLAEVAYQRDDLDAALRHAEAGIAACRQVIYTPPLATGLAMLAWIRQAQGDRAGALAAMAEADRAGPGAAVTSLLNPVPAQRARLLLAQGEVAEAARWAEDRRLSPADEAPYSREPEYLVLARVLLAQDEPGQALGLLDRMHAAAAAQERAGSITEIQALRALALAAAGNENAAVELLAGALTLACPQGYVRVFADAGAPMNALLARLVAAQRTEQAAARSVPLGCLARLLRASGGGDTGRGTTAAVPGLVDPLTARELEILGLLAAGTPNPAIAGQLVVTLHTVKKHVSHILGKLGAANRTEAVNRARQLGLIP